MQIQLYGFLILPHEYTHIRIHTYISYIPHYFPSDKFSITYTKTKKKKKIHVLNISEPKVPLINSTLIIGVYLGYVMVQKKVEK